MIIDTTEAKTKLANLRAIMPECSDHEAAFAAMVGARLPAEAEPSAVALAVATLIYDVEAGKAPSSQLTGLPPICYQLLDNAFDAVIKAVFPHDFAAETLAFRAKVRERAA